MENTPQRFKYYAFISYSHKDEKWAKWLHEKLENYKLPNIIRKETDGRLPKDIRPIFLDRTDINTGPLKSTLTRELEDSRFLIVVCSPNAAGSEWVDREVEHFIKIGRADRIIPFIVDGSPQPTAGQKQCYPPSLDKEILGATLEPSKEQAFVKIVASILGLKFDDLWQRHERRRKRQRNINYTVATLLTIFVAMASFLTWDHYRDKVTYYADYAERFGIPNGIYALTPEQAVHRAEHFKFTSSEGKLRKVEHVNSSGVPITYQEVTYSDMARPVTLKLIYSEKGDLERADHADQTGRVIMSHKYSGEDLSEIDIKTAKGKDMALFTTTGISKSLGVIQKTKINRYSVERNTKGEITKVVFKYGGFDVVCDGNGIYGYEYTRDDLGRITEMLYLDKDGAPMQNGSGVAGRSFEYDAYGNVISDTRFDLNREYTNDIGGFARYTATSDDNGNIVREAYFGEDGNAISCKAGYAQISFRYDDKACMVESRAWDKNGNPTLDSNGTSMIRCRYDDNGMRIREEYFDINGAHCYNKVAISMYQLEYNKDRLLASERYYDTQGRPCYGKGGYAMTKYEYDENGIPVQQTYYDENGQLFLGNDGYAICKAKVNENGDVTEIAYFDTDGEPCYFTDRYSILRAEYDVRGNLKKYAFYDTKERPCFSTQGFSITTMKFDDNGNIIEQAYFDTQGMPCFRKTSEVYSRLSAEYEKNKVTISRFGDDGLPCLDETWIARSVIVFNDLGKPISTYFYGLEDEPVMCKSGYAQMHTEYDAKGNISRESYYDADGLLLDGPYAIAIMEYDHNDRGQMIEMRAYNNNRQLISEPINGSCAINKKKYDDRGNLVEASYFDRYGYLMSGICRTEYRYNEKDEKVEERSYNKASELAYNDNGFAIARYTYDLRGNILEENYFGTDGKPVISRDRYATERNTYDRNGKHLSVSFYDTDNKPCKNYADEHMICYRYDERGFSIADSILGTDLSPSNNDLGTHRYLREFDARGNALRYIYVPLDGTVYKKTAPVIQMRYDKRDNRIERISTDMNGDLFYYSSASCPVTRYTYDARGVLTSTIDYKTYTEPCSFRGGGRMGD
ncbi:hypothetical protein GCM10023093_01050 [Nemorincola caseinilytica]|uniref:TIR domain-containing protein n=1 Tax=Nemorincola caseinilytica TaxID=2054315 RepID=A0ABP8N552_9BACT